MEPTPTFEVSATQRCCNSMLTLVDVMHARQRSGARFFFFFFSLFDLPYLGGDMMHGRKLHRLAKATVKAPFLLLSREMVLSMNVVVLGAVGGAVYLVCDVLRPRVCYEASFDSYMRDFSTTMTVPGHNAASLISVNTI